MSWARQGQKRRATTQLEKLPDNEKVVMVNSVPVFIDKKAVERIAEITIDTKNGRLIMIDPQASGGCC